MNERLDLLLHRFRQQERFSTGYSPLYAALFGTVANWISLDPAGDISSWLLEASDNRPSFNVSNLLAAGLHREVLMGAPGVSELASFYPSVGGDAAMARLFDQSNQEPLVSDQFQEALRNAIFTRQKTLRDFIQTYNVQTNETGRGFIWLLPVSTAGVKHIHLLDLGASAGLNLAAERRSFHFVDDQTRTSLFNLGVGRQEEFLIRSQGTKFSFNPAPIPMIGSRTGCDIRPFPLKTAADELALTSFIWADQLPRLQRLREGIAAYHEVNKSQAPVILYQAALPDGLAHILTDGIETNADPLIIYNTYVKMYLPEKGAELREILSRWAKTQDRPVIWLQWEPQKFIAMDLVHEPEFGWLAWTAELWFRGEHRQWQLGWVHPHGQVVQWLPGMKNWIDYWQEKGKQTIIH